MSSAAAILALALSAQPGGMPQIDHALHPNVRAIVEKAIEAELDPKRGGSTAAQMLQSEIDKRKSKMDEQLSLRLRFAGVELRRRFLMGKDFPEPVRYEQCLSTFARLDLTDPGLKEWLERSLKHHPYAKQRLGKKKQRTIKAALLVRGADLDPKDIKKRFQKALRDVGFDIAFVPAKKATMILKMGAESAKSPDGSQRAVRVVLGLESVKDGRAVWQHELFRTVAAKDLKVAIDDALSWLVKIGGRDMFFRWLGERAFKLFLARGDGLSVATGRDLVRGSGGHDGHDH